MAPHTHRASLPRFAARADWLQYRTPKPNQRLQPPPPPPLPLPRKMANLNKGESGLPPTAFAQAPSRPRPITPANRAPPPRMSTAQAFQWPHPLPGFDTAFRRRTTQAPSTSSELSKHRPELYTTQALTRPPPFFFKTVYLFLSVHRDPPPWGQMRKRSSSQVGVGILVRMPERPRETTEFTAGNSEAFTTESGHR